MRIAWNAAYRTEALALRCGSFNATGADRKSASAIELMR